MVRRVIATPARHGPPLSRPIVGEATGFALRWPGQLDGVLWISGDTVLFELPSRSGHTWRIGLSVCYDLRFPELYRRLSAAGAEVLSINQSHHSLEDVYLALVAEAAAS